MNATQGRTRSSLAVLIGAMLPAVVLAADIVGTPGPDVLEGTPEADKINGKGGADVMMGLAGDDSFVVGQRDDQVLEAVGDGTDTIRASVTYTLPINVENMTLEGSAPINAIGNELNNRLTGNSADNVLDGGAGADRMFGLGGNDIYVVDSKNDKVNETANNGIDTVRSSVTFTLGANVERLALTGTTAVNGTGNELRNKITGNIANNTLNGLAGDDLLKGGSGNDRLIGGPGNDRLIGGPGLDEFQFDAPLDALTNQDRIFDFNPADDTIRLIGAAFPALTPAGTLSVAAFANGANASSADVRILHDPATGVLRYDPDGSGPEASVRFARLVEPAALTNADFVVADPVVTAVDFESQIQAIFTSRCINCHNAATAPHNLVLESGQSHSRLVNVASAEVPSLMRVKPGDPDNSYLVQKLKGTAAVGSRMPPPPRDPLTAQDIALIRQWISEGAKP